MQPQNKINLNTSEQQQVGIVSYISEGHAIPAVTKYMLTDFIVNEINQDQQVVMLKAKPNPNIIIPNKQSKPEHQNKVCYQLTKQTYDGIAEHFNSETAQAISQLYKKLDAGEKITQWEHLVENMPAMNKEQRMKIHDFVRQKLVNIESNTLDGNKMKLKLNKKMKKINPAARHKYVHFVMFKSNIDTMGAVFKLSKIVGVSQKLFSTAGLKDKRGVTTQMVSVYNTPVSTLQKFYKVANRNKEMWISGFKENMDTDIGVGDLWGNQFGLVLRLINPRDASLIEDRVKSLKQIGMINYFGMQRFGSCGTKTHMIGLKLLKKQWKQIIQQLLLQDTKDDVINKLKAQSYEKQQYGRAQRELPNKYKIQKNIFKGLKRLGKNYQNVFQSLPRSIKTLYPHSLQSYIFNKIVTKRVNGLGLEVVEGDLVGKRITGFQKLKAQVDQQKQLKINENEKKQEQADEDGVQNAPAQEQSQQKYEVELVTKQNKHIYRITDIVMPLYGPMISLPKQSLAYSYLLEQLKSLDLTQQQFTNNNSKKLCFKGMYRKIIVKPTNVSSSIICHQNIKDEVQSPFYTIGEQPNVEFGSKKAVRLVLQLPKSSYATMALRQILHIPSSFQAQMALNKLYQQQQQDKTKSAMDNGKQMQKLEEERQAHKQ